MAEETPDCRYYQLANGFGHNLLKVQQHKLCGPPTIEFLKKFFDRPIVAFTEMRQNFWAYQPESWITYHVSTILEVDGPSGEKLFVLIERVDDRLEIMIGVGFVARSFMLEFRATGKPRRADRCFQQPRQIIRPSVSLRLLFEWLGNHLAKKWKPYHILQSNCQHIAQDIQDFLVAPGEFQKAPTPSEIDNVAWSADSWLCRHAESGNCEYVQEVVDRDPLVGARHYPAPPGIEFNSHGPPLPLPMIPVVSAHSLPLFHGSREFAQPLPARDLSRIPVGHYAPMPAIVGPAINLKGMTAYPAQAYPENSGNDCTVQ